MDIVSHANSLIWMITVAATFSTTLRGTLASISNEMAGHCGRTSCIIGCMGGATTETMPVASAVYFLGEPHNLVVYYITH